MTNTSTKFDAPIVPPCMIVLHYKFNMRQINNENCAKFVHSYVHTFYTQISCIENTFDTWINVFMDEVQAYEWTNVIRILHLSINSCVKCVFNAWYQCLKHTNYEWTNVTQFLFLSHEMLSLHDITLPFSIWTSRNI